METKTPLGLLYEALAKAQAEFTPPKKTHHVDFLSKKTNQRIKYSYADLADVLESIKPLAKHGLSITQVTGFRDGVFGLITTLGHSGGGVVESFQPLPNPTTMDPQAYGSALTYSRRYTVSGVTGIASEEDDDGANAKDKFEPPAKKSPPRQPRQVSPPPPQDLDQALGDPEEFEDPGKHVVTFGKFKGKRLNQIDSDQLWSYLDFLDQKAHEQKKEITGPVKVFVDTATAYLKSLHPPVEDFMSQPEPSWEGE